MVSFGNGESHVYAVCLMASAGSQLEEEHRRLADINNYELADSWRDGLMEAIRSLATFPERCIVAPEDKHFRDGPVRQLLYRRKHGPTWRILFTAHEADENDPPTVRVYHIRHGAQAPMTEWPTDDE
jgi:plasmid stabilization system protein ParE